MNILGFFQRLGRALQLPIAVLPVAALLLRFGQPDLLNVPFIAQAGGAIFDNLALIFAIGVASSWSKDNAGSAALAGAVGYFVMTKAMVTINPEINMGVLAGIITGLAGRIGFGKPIPFGPCLLFAAAIWILGGYHLWAWYCEWLLVPL